MSTKKEVIRNPFLARTEKIKELWKLYPYGKDINHYSFTPDELVEIGDEKHYWYLISNQEYVRKIDLKAQLQILVAVLRKRQLENPRKLFTYNYIFELMAMSMGDTEGKLTAEFFLDLEISGLISVKNQKVSINI